MTNGRPESASTSPNVSTARRSASAAAWKPPEVDHAIARGGRVSQGVEIINGAAKHLGPGGGEGRGRGIRAGEPCDPMARGDELGNDGGADPAGRAGDEHAHEKTSR